jgi:hypothetical protein
MLGFIAVCRGVLPRRNVKPERVLESLSRSGTITGENPLQWQGKGGGWWSQIRLMGRGGRWERKYVDLDVSD